MQELEVFSSTGESRRLAVDGARLVIGRGSDSDVFLPDQLLSRRHAEIDPRDGSCWVVDLGSTNGTFVNGERVVGERRLHHGDLIVVGVSKLVYSERASHDGRPEPLPIGGDTGEIALMAGGAQSYAIADLQSRVTSRAMEVIDLSRQTRIFQLLGRASSSLFGRRPLPELFERVLDVIFEAVPLERCAIALLDGRGGRPEVRAARSRAGDAIARVSKAIARRVIEQRVALLIPNILDDDSLRRSESLIATGVRSAICVPLWLSPRLGMKEEIIGLVYADTRSEGRPFSRDDLEILTALSNVAASKIESTRLAEANREKERLEGEMQMAAEIQQSILPREPPPVPGVELDGESRSCEGVGGDYHDFLWDGGELSLTVADVSGKGLGAAMLMTSLRTAVHAHWREAALSKVAVRINRTFFESVPFDRYATCFLARFDPITGLLTYVSAGHPPALLVRASGVCEALSEGGPGLGLFEATEFEEGARVMEPGDTLLAYSDGVSESWPTQAEAEVRLIDLVRAAAPLPISALPAQILAAVDRQNGGLRRDDCTVIALRWIPTSGVR